MKLIETKDELKKYWDTRAKQQGDRTVGFSGDSKQQHKTRTEEWTRKFTPYWDKFLLGNMLDFGCGVGRFAKCFHGFGEMNGTYYGTDITAKLLEIARDNNPGHKFSLMTDPEKLPFKDGFFDSIWTCTVLQHCVVPDMISNILKEFYRISKEDCKILIYENTAYSLRNPHIWFRKQDEWINLFKDHGFKIEPIESWKEGAGEQHTLFGGTKIKSSGLLNKAQNKS